MYKELLDTMDKTTHVYNALQYMIKHGSITSYEAFVELKNTRLSSTIYELRNRYGVDIDVTIERTPNNKWYGVYTLSKEG